MSHTFQTSASNNQSRYTSILSYYMVTVEDFDNESYDFTVEARSAAHASEVVSEICAESFIDINIMCVYSID